jgi:hypothetical protein
MEEPLRDAQDALSLRVGLGAGIAQLGALAALG